MLRAQITMSLSRHGCDFHLTRTEIGVRNLLNNSAAALIIVVGAITLRTQAVAAQGPPVIEYCCTSGNGYTCCGTSYCAADQTSCKAEDK